VHICGGQVRIKTITRKVGIKFPLIDAHKRSQKNLTGVAMIKMQQGVHERMQALSAVRKSQDEVKAQMINMQFA
jgi:hypothetical protein